MGMMGFTNAGAAGGPTSGYDAATAGALNIGGTASVTLDVNTNGTITQSVTGTPTGSMPSAWYTPTTTSIGNSYWVRATLNSGTAVTGTVGSWLALTAARSWTQSASGGNTVTSVLSIDISSSATGTPVVATGLITLEAVT
jgi:hypothetical protein